MRTACYARFSSDLQRTTSADDQIRACREYAKRQGWMWQEEHVYRDNAISGVSLEGRSGLHTLLAAAASTPPPFEVLLVDDSSRVARDLADALRVLQHMKFASVRVIFISQNIDSDHEQSETLVTVHGLVDGLYLREMAAKIRRGLAGQLTRGFATGGVTYGYRTVRVPDPIRPDAHVGYRIEIEPSEAAYVHQVFAWYAEGMTLPAIIAKLHEAGAAAPRGGGSRGDWRIGAVRRLLANQRYLGRLIWGRSRSERKPGTRAKVQRRVAPSEWQVAERPDLRIIDDALWERVQRRRQTLTHALSSHRQPGRSLLRGRCGAIHGRGLFSGFLRCGECGRAVSIVSQHRYRGRVYRYYGCASYAKNGHAVCTNRVTTRAEDAEQALLAGVQAEITRPETLEYIVARLSAALQAATDTRPHRLEALLRQRELVTQKIGRLVSLIESGTTSTALLQALRAREAELATAEAEIAAVDAPIDAGRLAVIPSWVRQQAADVVTLLQERPDRVKAELSRLGVRFTVHPVYDVPEGQRPYLRAVGEGDFEALVGAGSSFPATGSSPLLSAQRTAPLRLARSPVAPPASPR
jgi:site-specific DNA recombinase